MRLDPADVETIAQRVAELVAAPLIPNAVRYVDAAHLATTLGVERDWVYAHAGQLGAIRLGGPQGRLRFDVNHVQRTLGEREPASDGKTSSRRPARRGRITAAGLDLLPFES